MSNGARGWILWTSLGIMCADSLISLLPVVAEYAVDFVRKHRRGHIPGNDDTRKVDNETETPDRLVPSDWVILGLVTSIIIGTFLVWLVFGNEGIKPWATVLGFILGGLLSIIGCVAVVLLVVYPVNVFTSVFVLSEKQILTPFQDLARSRNSSLLGSSQAML
jgi:hypothetical protein